jgi:hypothetical protein
MQIITLFDVFETKNELKFSKNSESPFKLIYGHK